MLIHAAFCFLCLLFSCKNLHSFPSGNQTDSLSSVYPGSTLPFTLEIVASTSLQIPGGIQTYSFGVHNQKWLLLGGRTNGLHGFDSSNDNFPPQQQNTTVFVLDLKENKVYSKSLYDPTACLSQAEIDSLSTTAQQYRQIKQKLYVVGGYGVDTSTGLFGTKSTLSSIDVPGLIHWVQNPSSGETAKQHIKQIINPIFQVTGGALYQVSPHSPFLLIFGQNFEGAYRDGSNGLYTQQVRTFRLIDEGTKLAVFDLQYHSPDPSYRRRDLNIVPRIQKKEKSYDLSFLALSGVFTLDNGIWTVPVFINGSGKTSMPDPSLESTFKQGMNSYNCPHIGLFSKKNNEMHTLLFGGASYETHSNGDFSLDAEIPFTNNVTDVVLYGNQSMAQYLIEAEYPEILSTFANPGNPLLFGAGARFLPANTLPSFSDSAFLLDSLKKRTLLGYIVGGIMSSLPNTNTRSDSAASPYIFQVFATPQ